MRSFGFDGFTTSYALIRKDLKGYFDQPTGYILIVIFVALLAYWFFQTVFTTEEASLRALFTVEFTIERPSLPWLLAIFVPAATMRLLAEEQRDGTLEILLTQPIQGWIVLAAKFAAGMIFVSVAILATLGIPILMEITAGDLDWGAVAAQYIGSIFLAGAMVSVGLFTSSLTRNQIVAFILALFFIMVLMFIGLDEVAVTLPSRIATLLQTLSPVTHFSSIARGVIDLRDVLYFVALIFTFLSATFLMMRAKTLSHQSPQYLNLRLGVAGLIVLSLLIGWFGNAIGGRLDLTADKRFTLSDGTKQILDSLDDVLTIEFFQSKEPPVQVALTARDVSDFLDDLARSSDGKVRVVRKYPDEDEEAAEKAQILGVTQRAFERQSQGEFNIKTGYLGLSMTYTDQRETIAFIDSIDGFEYRVATLANKMMQQNVTSVAFLKGHGERELGSQMTAFNILLQQQYNVFELELVGDQIPDLSTVDVLIIPGPTQLIPDAAKEEIHRWILNGGKAMVMVDPVAVDTQQFIAQPNFDNFAEFLTRYGVIVEDDVVFDMRSHETLPFSTSGGAVNLEYPYWMRVQAADRKVVGGVDTVVLPWASPIGVTDAQVAVTETIPLLETSPFAGVDFQPGNLRPFSSPPWDESLTQEQLFQNLMAVAVTGPASGTSDGDDTYRLVAVGDSDWITDQLVNRYSNNLLLGLNLVDWLTQDETLASIRSKVVAPRTLVFTSSGQRNLIQYVNVAGIPAAFIVLGLARFARRRSGSLRVYKREE